MCEFQLLDYLTKSYVSSLKEEGGFGKKLLYGEIRPSVKEGVVSEEQVGTPHTIIMFNLLYYMLRSRRCLTSVET